MFYQTLICVCSHDLHVTSFKIEHVFLDGKASIIMSTVLHIRWHSYGYAFKLYKAIFNLQILYT